MPFAPANERSYVDQMWDYLHDKPVGFVLSDNDPNAPFSGGEPGRNGDMQALKRRMEERQQRTIVRADNAWTIRSGVEHFHDAQRLVSRSYKAVRRAALSLGTIDKTEMTGADQANVDLARVNHAKVAKIVNKVTRRRQSPEDILADLLDD